MPGSGNYVHGLTCYSCMVISRPVSCSSFNLIAQLALGPYPFPFSLSLCGFSSYVHCIYLCGELSWQATRSKDVFSKHVESVLAKCAKLRSLSADLQKNYAECPTAKKFLGSMSGGAIQQWFPCPLPCLWNWVANSDVPQGNSAAQCRSPNLGHRVQQVGGSRSQGRARWPQWCVAKWHKELMISSPTVSWKNPVYHKFPITLCQQICLHLQGGARKLSSPWSPPPLCASPKFIVCYIWSRCFRWGSYIMRTLCSCLALS